MSYDQPPSSNQPPAPGWWLASDGNWYPPQQQPQQQPPPPTYAPPNQGYQPPGQAYPPQQGQWYPNQAPPSNGLAIAALILGILSIVLCWAFGLGILLGIAGVVLGALGLSKSNELPGQAGRGQAIAGLITGAIGALLSIVLIAGIIALGNAVSDELDDLEINTDPSDGVCDPDRFLQDPDC